MIRRRGFNLGHARRLVQQCRLWPDLDTTTSGHGHEENRP